MPARPIHSLKPNVTEADALRAFSSAGFSKLFWTFRHGPLRCIAPIYVPFWLYRASYRLNRSDVMRWFALDAVDGSLDLFAFPGVPSNADLLSLETRNLLAAHLDPALAEARLREKILRLIFQQGFFKLRNVELQIVRDPLELYVPYWLAFYGRSSVTAQAGTGSLRAENKNTRGTPVYPEAQRDHLGRDSSSTGTLARADDPATANPSNTRVRCRVLDAVRRKFEGAKASAFFEHWLAQ